MYFFLCNRKKYKNANFEIQNPSASLLCNLFVRQGTSNRPFIRGMIILRKFGTTWDDLLTVTIHFLAVVSCFKGTH